MGQRVAEGECRQGVRGAAHGAIPSPKHPAVDITAPNEAPQNFWALPHLKGAMSRSDRQCGLVSAEIARRQQAEAPPFSVGRKHL